MTGRNCLCYAPNRHCIPHERHRQCCNSVVVHLPFAYAMRPLTQGKCHSCPKFPSPGAEIYQINRVDPEFPHTPTRTCPRSMLTRKSKSYMLCSCASDHADKHLCRHIRPHQTATTAGLLQQPLLLTQASKRMNFYRSHTQISPSIANAAMKLHTRRARFFPKTSR